MPPRPWLAPAASCAAERDGKGVLGGVFPYSGLGANLDSVSAGRTMIG